LIDGYNIGLSEQKFFINNENSYIYYKIIFPTTTDIYNQNLGVRVNEIKLYYRKKLDDIIVLPDNIGQYVLDTLTNDIYVYKGKDTNGNSVFDLTSISEFKTNSDFIKFDSSTSFVPRAIFLQSLNPYNDINYIISVTSLSTSPNNATFEKAFDNNFSTKFSGYGTNVGGVIRLNNNLSVKAISFVTSNESYFYDPTSYKLYGSNDNINYILINEDNIILPNNRLEPSGMYYVNNTISCTYYKIIFPTTIFNNSGNLIVHISEIKLYYNNNNISSVLNDNIYMDFGKYALDTSDGKIYYVDQEIYLQMPTKVYKLVTNLNPLSNFTDKRLNFLNISPSHISFDSDNNLFVNIGDKLYKIDSNKFLSALPQEFFNSINSLIVKNNDIFYVDGNDKCIYKIQKANTLTNYTKSLFCGLGTDTDGFLKDVKLNYPVALNRGENDDFLLIDSSNILHGFNIKKIYKKNVDTYTTYDAFINVSNIPTITMEADYEFYKYYDFEFLGFSDKNIGPIGQKGNKGKRGPTGIPGFSGITGPRGNIGAKNINSDDRPMGPLGPTGPIGPTGKNNNTPGPTGNKGNEYVWQNVYDFDKYYNHGDIYTKDNSVYQISEDSFYTTKTIAGNGTQGYKNSIGTESKFNNPHAFAIDKYKNIYVVDRGNNCVRKIEYSSKIVTTIAGNINQGYKDGFGVDTMFNYPSGIAIDKNGENIYVSDTGNNCIRKITYNGKDYITTTFAGNQEEGDLDDVGTTAMFNSPEGLYLDTNTKILYVADTENNKIKIVLQNGSVMTIAGNGVPEFLDGEGTSSCFNNPKDLSGDRFGNIYVADTYNNRIRKINKKGFIKTMCGSNSGYLDGFGTNALFALPSCISIDGDDNIYVGDNSHVLRKIINKGDNYEVTTFAGEIYENGYIDSANINDVRFINISDILVDTNNTIYIADEDNNVIREIYNTKENLLIPGGKGPKGETGVMNIKEGDVPILSGKGGEIIINETNMYICSSDGKWYKMSGLTKIV
jgi:serine/threonine-protein kinase